MKGLCRALLLIAALRAQVASAQSDTLGYRAPAPRWVAQFTTMSANAAIGGLTAGIFQRVRGGSFQDGFARGALGGVIIYTGKRVVAERFTGAGLIGRELAAVGSSVVRNASDGIGNFDRLIIPAGITRIYWDRVHRRANVKLDIVAAGFVIYGVMEEDLEFDVRESLFGGTAVFRTNNKVISFGPQREHAGGLSEAGTLYRSDVPGWGKDFLRRALAHERVHVLQDDQLFITLNDHLDDYLLSKAGLRTVSRYADINGVTQGLKLLARLIPNHGDRPWETEANYLVR